MQSQNLRGSCSKRCRNTSSAGSSGTGRSGAVALSNEGPTRRQIGLRYRCADHKSDPRFLPYACCFELLQQRVVLVVVVVMRVET